MIYPSDYASYVWILSGGVITEQSLHYLLWELPLKIGNQLYHAAILHLPMTAGVKTIPLEDFDITNMEKLHRIVEERMKARRKSNA